MNLRKRLASFHCVPARSMRGSGLQPGSVMTKKAQVHDSIQLEFPEWFPSALRVDAEEQFALQIKEGTSQDVLNRLCRLVAHPDMKKVWNELYRKIRTDRREFFHPANPIKCYPGSVDEWQRYIAQLRSRGGSIQFRQAQEIEQNSRSDG